ncbi:MAG: phosphoribosylformimino-5-aminoimidazole carboxamide ribotide isomerase [Archaeoglobi archaeon]|nr:phosphoribosylformimino-5-aminoimidazole carboxamide ribotide isomerase [Archaeoglobi archaeon]MDK2781625.1 phosphoribosylformimino-5-aminoimidazole carboxamide ribotide isomerase [Archaeoglobi archaeon]
MDLRNGIAVHAFRGERDKYEPVEKFSRVVRSSNPLEILETLRVRELYVADLDAIEGKGDNFRIIEMLSQKASVMADCGVRDEEGLRRVRDLGCTPVLGTETAGRRLFEIAEGCIASVDMMGGRILGGWRDLRDVLEFLNDTPVEEIIVLDISRVGTKKGWRREELEEILSISEKPVIIGGGVRKDDLDLLSSCGIAGVLLSTSVHLGEIEL